MTITDEQLLDVYLSGVATGVATLFMQGSQGARGECGHPVPVEARREVAGRLADALTGPLLDDPAARHDLLDSLRQMLATGEPTSRLIEVYHLGDDA